MKWKYTVNQSRDLTASLCNAETAPYQMKEILKNHFAHWILADFEGSYKTTASELLEDFDRNWGNCEVVINIKGNWLMMLRKDWQRFKELKFGVFYPEHSQELHLSDVTFYLPLNTDDELHKKHSMAYFEKMKKQFIEFGNYNIKEEA